VSGLLYYLPAVTDAEKVPALRDRGLTAGPCAVLDAERVFVRTVATGPDGAAGIIVADAAAWENSQNRPGFFPDRQTWEEIDRIWVGFFTADRPRPADLARDQQVGGHTVTLEDGREYLVPVARAMDGHSPLPSRLRLGPAGELVSKVLPQYAALFTRAAAYWDAKTEYLHNLAKGIKDAEAGTTVADAFHLAADALNINYRLHGREVSALNLLSTSSCLRVLDALVDFPTLMDEVKKKAGAVNLSDGRAD